MVEFSRESVIIVEQNPHLVLEHWNEVVIDKRRGDKPIPDWETFKALEKNNSLITFIAYQDGIVIGYAMFVLHRDLHQKENLVALNDAVFIQKDKRPTGAGGKFLKYCDAELKNFGVKIILWHIKPHVDFSGTLKKLGYVLNEMIYMKITGE